MNPIQHEFVVAAYERSHAQLVSQLEDCERELNEAMGRADRNYDQVLKVEREVHALRQRSANLADNSEYWFAQVNQREETISTLAEDGRTLEAQRDQAEASANRWFALAMLSEGVHECKYFSCTEA